MTTFENQPNKIKNTAQHLIKKICEADRKVRDFIFFHLELGLEFLWDRYVVNSGCILGQCY